MAKGDRIYQQALKEAIREEADLDTVYNLLKKAISIGNPRATYALATWYLFGRYVKVDHKEAVKLLKKSALANIPEACYDLAVCYETGEGIKKDE